jgi:hypothetical protein
MLHFGVDRQSLKGSRVRAHCWITIDGATVLNPPSRSMVEVLAYDGSSIDRPRQFSPEIEASSDWIAQE